ncbi:Na+ dependent nucleoside transporter C-terminus-domain-containing protein [Suillus paluster]|uniref:Na+ dependent nucleoside transporter C-terminus-domain-containing protein n=1 Tax=Suillus paluster TaxID=48578 RepID=UPI001B873C33|nr:Na+ dependent nucleoside transporter C-terminus-domain-containing protein [Suillus paluster]KAG1751608.1 Na+ dependent nucleoside transporter C-terminus-domain-containing protein [Suillus paluster]
MAASAGGFDEENQFVQRKTSVSTTSDEKKATASNTVDTEGGLVDADKEGIQAKTSFDKKLRVIVLIGLAALILGWWISSTILKATRGRWLVQTIFAWFFLITIAFRFIPNSVVTEPVAAVWIPYIQEPWYRLPRKVRLTTGWLCLLGIVFGSAFGFPLTGNTDYGHRAISVLGLFVFQCGFYLSSTNRSAICWPTVIVGLILQQAIALFVLKSGAGFSLFKYIADLANDFLSESLVGAQFFFDAETIAKKWFFINTLSAVIFFIATIQMLYYLGVMQWIVKGFAWFFFKLMNVSGAEAVVAAASPWVGQGESACLVKPYVDIMTPSELHLVMTSGFSTISGAVLTAYIALGVPPQNLITSSVMSIPASISISKLRIPEVEEPVTRGRIVVDRGDADKNRPVNALHAFSLGGLFGLNVAGQILTNVLTILSLVATINAVLTWVGRGFGIHQLTLQLVLGYIGYPIAFFLGVPSAEILRVSQLLATKLIENEFVAYLELSSIQTSSNPLSQRAFTIASYSLCGFANLGSLGVQIGVLSALAPSRGKTIAKIAMSAMICGFISTLQTAGIAGMLI